MGKNEDRRIQQQLMTQNTQYNQQFLQYLERANQPTEEETELANRRRGWREYFRAGNFDAESPEPLIHSGMWKPAMLNKEMERVGVGAGQFGIENANPTAVALNRQYQADRMAQEGAIERTEALSAKQAEVNGETLPFISMMNNRSMGLANLMGNMSQNATQQMASFRPAPSPWWGIAGAAVGGVSGMFTGRFGGRS